MLTNRCDYPVVVSYCIDRAGNASVACAAVGGHVTATQRLGARQTLALETHDATLTGNDVKWIACRSLPGVTGRLSDDGNSGQCSAPAPVIQALAQHAQ
ncbi:MAG: hypothetical protein QM661_11700 [Solimonas sp.]